MFFAILFIVIGLIILLNTLGFMSGSFWGFLWAALFLIVGFRMLVKKGKCPICGWGHWGGKMHGKIHQKIHDEGHDHQHEDQKQED